MNKRNKWLLLLALLIIISLKNASAQQPPSKEQLKRALEMAEKLRKQSENGDDREKITEEARKILKPFQKTVLSIPKKKEETFPKVILTPVQKRTIRDSALPNYVKQLSTQIYQTMSAASKEFVDEIIGNKSLDEEGLLALATQGYAVGALKEGTFLACIAVTRDPLNDLNVINLSAMLINGGAPAQAMPICRGLVSGKPSNPIMINNLAQAFIGIGEKDSAMVYLRKCIAKSPAHPQANHTAAQISKANGNKAQALQYAKKSVEGGMNLGAMEIIDELDESGYAYNFFAKDKNMPDYFDLYELKKPRHQKTIAEEQIVISERLAFKEEIMRLREQVSQLAAEENKKGKEQLERHIANFQKRLIAGEKIKINMENPYFEMGAKVVTNRYIQHDVRMAIYNEEKRYHAEIAHLETEYNRNKENIIKDYTARKAKYECGEGNSSGCSNIERLTLEECKAIDLLSNRFLVACATAGEAYDTKQLYWARERFHFNSKWEYLAAPNEHLGNAAYYKAADEYLYNVSRIIETYRPKSPYCEKLKAELAKMSFLEFITPKCPINVTAEFGILGFKSNCKESSLTVKGKEGTWTQFLKGQVRYNHALEQYTIAGIVVLTDGKMELPKSVQNTIRLKAGVKAEVTGQVYYTFANGGRAGDLGVKATIAGSAYASDTITGIGESIEASVEGGYAINAGWSASSKGLNEIFGKTEVLPEYKP